MYLPISKQNQILSAADTGDKLVGRGRKEELRKVCQDFEALFIFELLKGFRKTVPVIGTIKIPGRSTYEMIMDQKLAEELAHKGQGIGIGSLLYEKLSRQEEKRAIGQKFS